MDTDTTGLAAQAAPGPEGNRVGERASNRVGERASIQNATEHLDHTRLALRAVTHRWDVHADRREKALQAAEAILDDPTSSKYHRLAAAKLLVAADGVNVRREANQVAERSGDDAARVAALRTALQSPEARAWLAAGASVLSPPASETTVDAPAATVEHSEAPAATGNLGSELPRAAVREVGISSPSPVDEPAVLADSLDLSSGAVTWPPPDPAPGVLPHGRRPLAQRRRRQRPWARYADGPVLLPGSSPGEGEPPPAGPGA
jgi:hypothetical protein